MKLWIMQPGSRDNREELWRSCRTRGVIRLGFDGTDDFSSFGTRAELKAHVLERRPPDKGRKKTRGPDACANFYFGVQPGDRVLAAYGRREFVGFGVFQGPYYYADEEHYRHFREVDWLISLEKPEAIEGQVFSRDPINDVTRLRHRVEQINKIVSGFLLSPDEHQPVADVFDELSIEMARRKKREGQIQFRQLILEQYGNRCAVTRYDCNAALEAAHIRPYSGAKSNVLSNGILLRADIHKLFDAGLISIDQESRRVAIAKKLEATSYAALAGVKIVEPLSNEARPIFISD